MSKMKTHQQYIDEVKMKNFNIEEIIDEYQGATTKIRHKYKRCGHINYVQPSSVLQGYGCTRCNPSRTGIFTKKSEKDFLEEVSVCNPNIKIIGKYTFANKPIECECLICGKLWSPVADSIIGIKPSGCPICGINKNAQKRSLSHEEYLIRLLNINPYLEVLDKYINTTTPLEHRCIICNYKWEPLPTNILSGSGCPICAMSRGERQIMALLDKYDIQYKPQKTFNDLVGVGGGLLSYDFFLPIFNTLIEFQGEQHEKSHGGIFGGQEQFEIQLEHDRRKFEYAQIHNINLIEIWYDEIDEIEDILIEKLNLQSVETAGVA